MEKYDIHICLVSAQAAANLLPMLDKEFRPKKAILIYTQTMKKNAEYLQTALKNNGIKSDLKLLSDEFDLNVMEDELIKYVSEYENENIAANITGGTKLMSITLFRIFEMLDKPTFYVETDKNHILFTSKHKNSDKFIESRVMNTKISIENYLTGYGNTKLKDNTKEIDLSRVDNISFLIREYDKYKNSVPLLNKYASMSRNSGYKIDLDNKDRKIIDLDKLLTELDDVNFIRFSNGEINFKSKE